MNKSTPACNRHDENKQDQGLLSLIKTDALGREIFLVLLVKLLLIVLLWWLFFDLPDEHAITSKQVSQQILGSQSIHRQPYNR